MVKKRKLLPIFRHVNLTFTDDKEIAYLLGFLLLSSLNLLTCQLAVFPFQLGVIFFLVSFFSPQMKRSHLMLFNVYKPLETTKENYKDEKKINSSLI